MFGSNMNNNNPANKKNDTLSQRGEPGLTARKDEDNLGAAESQQRVDDPPAKADDSNN
jgi:hypothetical protein